MGGGFTPPPGGIVPGPAMGAGAVGPAWSPTDALGFGWNVVTKRFGAVAIPIAVAVFVYFVPSYLVNFAASFTISLLDQRGVVDHSLAPFAALGASGVGVIVSMVVGSYMAGGICNIGLKAARGQPTTVGDGFAGGRFFVPTLVAMILFSIAYIIGIALCIVPGVIVGIGLCLYEPIIVDQGLSGVDALKKSWELTKGHRVNILIFGILCFFVEFAGILACGIGLFLVAIPVIVVSACWVYLRIKGEAVPEPA
jgi:uncharacterized membrane protein